MGGQLLIEVNLRGRERPWEAVHRSLSISADQDDPRAVLAADARALGATYRDPRWTKAQQWSRGGRFLTPEEAEQVTNEVRRILDRYQDRQADPSLRPPGAPPVEYAFYTFPIEEFAEIAGAESAGAAEESQDIS